MEIARRVNLRVRMEALLEAAPKAPARIRAYAKKTVPHMQAYLGANSDPTFRVRDAEKLRQRVLQRVEKIARDTGMDVEDVWGQIESQARKAGLVRPRPGQHF